MKLVKAFIVATIVFLVVDIAWIVLVVSAEYNAALGSLMQESPSIVGAVLFYVGYILGILYFAVRPALEAGRVGVAALNGALLGALAYGTYTLTNYTIFAVWTVGLVISDTLWGAFLTSISAAAGYFAARR
jgi:uncharacterized membrane protein